MENKVAKKAIVTIDLLELIAVNNIKSFDLKPFLFQGLLLREKDYRNSLKAFDFSEYNDKLVYLHNSADAIIPMWAYMLLASYLTELNIPHIFASNKTDAINLFISEAIASLNPQSFEGKRVVVKGCSGEIKVSEQNYIKLTQKLKPVVKAISFGEACSMVPISKN